MATLLDLCKIKHHAVRSDGAKFLDGERDDTLDTSWLTVNNGQVTLDPGLYDELLVVNDEVTDDQIKAWANLGAPFYDPTPVIQENQIPAAETWNKAVHDAQRALADAADAQATADGKVTTYYQDTEPIAEALGDLWVHTGEDNKLYRWSGSSWEVVQDKKIQEAVQKAEDAQATADGKIVTFYQSTPPTATAAGDLWVDTDDNNHLYRWSGTAWVDVQDKSPIPDERIPSAEDWNRKARTFYQDTAPTATGIGDIWFDTSDHHHRYWWDGAKWADANDDSPVDASKRPIHARGLNGDIEIDSTGMSFIRKDGTETETVIRMDIGTGSAYFKGDITGASGTFSGSLSAEKIIEGIEVYGGLTADHIKAGEISYDQLNVAFAKVTSVHMSGFIGGGSTAQLIQSATSQNDRNIIRLNLKAGDEPWIGISHNSLRLIAGMPLVFADGGDLGFPIEPTPLGDSTARWAIAVAGVYANRTWYKFEERLGGGDLTIDLLFQRHAIS